MRVLYWLASCWPGFAQAWLAARWEGLVLAIAFAAALNGALLTSLVWTEWPGAGSPPGAGALAAWLVVLGLWIGGIIWLRRDTRLLSGSRTKQRDSQIESWFCEAQHEYLKGHWIEAESVLRNLLSREPNDVEAALLLAAIQKRTKLWSEAKQTLASLKSNEIATRWAFEIENELDRIAKLQREAAEGTDGNEQTSKAA